LVGTLQRLGLLTSVLALGPQIACGSSSPPSTGGGGGGGGGGGAAGGAGGMDAACGPEPGLDLGLPTCNMLTNGAPSVPFTANPGSPPTFAGRAIQDGLYFATTVEGYGTAAAAGRRLTLAITGGGTQLFWNGDVLDGTAQNIEETFAANATAAPAGSTLTLTTTCASVSPSPLPPSMSYTASATALVLAVLNGGTNVAVTTYTRQGCVPSPTPPDAL
jgi:hypothetical protein